jgi:hypothetical protein
MNWKHYLLIFAAYEVAAYVYNGWVAPNQASWPAAPLDLIGMIVPQVQQQTS